MWCKSDDNMTVDCDKLFLENNLMFVQTDYICSRAFKFANVYSDPTYDWFVGFMICITIFLAFFLFDQPHDCFRCLGKDPERTFSIM